MTDAEEIPSNDETITDNTLFGSASKDKINGKTGNDLIDGKGGNDQIDSGAGDDMIGGGAGSDNIKGGDGNDYISSSAGIQNTRQHVSHNDKVSDTWNRWGLPDGETAIQQGAIWGTYLSQQTPEFKVTVWTGITDTSTDKTDTEGDVVDGGAGNDWVIGSWASDRIKGGRLNGKHPLISPIAPQSGVSNVDLEVLVKKKLLVQIRYALSASLIIANEFSCVFDLSEKTRRTRAPGCKRCCALPHALSHRLAKRSTTCMEPIPCKF